MPGGRMGQQRQRTENDRRSGVYREHNARSWVQATFGFVAGLILGGVLWAEFGSRSAAEGDGLTSAVIWIGGPAVILAVAAHSFGERFWRALDRYGWWLWS